MTVASKDGVLTEFTGGALNCAVGVDTGGVDTEGVVTGGVETVGVDTEGVDTVDVDGSDWANAGAIAQNIAAAHNTTDGAAANRK